MLRRIFYSKERMSPNSIRITLLKGLFVEEYDDVKFFGMMYIPKTFKFSQ